MRSDSEKVKHAITRTVNQILVSGRMSRQEHLYLTSALLADQRITDEERLQINRVLEYVQTGRLAVVD
jgi:exopolysaccharide biosynthesis protein